MTAEEYFESKFKNKLSSHESWVIRFAEQYAEEKIKELKSDLNIADQSHEIEMKEERDHADRWLAFVRKLRFSETYHFEFFELLKAHNERRKG